MRVNKLLEQNSENSLQSPKTDKDSERRGLSSGALLNRQDYGGPCGCYALSALINDSIDRGILTGARVTPDMILAKTTNLKSLAESFKSLNALLKGKNQFDGSEAHFILPSGLATLAGLKNVAASLGLKTTISSADSYEQFISTVCNKDDKFTSPALFGFHPGLEGRSRVRFDADAALPSSRSPEEKERLAYQEIGLNLGSHYGLITNVEVARHSDGIINPENTIVTIFESANSGTGANVSQREYKVSIKELIRQSSGLNNLSESIGFSEGEGSINLLTIDTQQQLEAKSGVDFGLTSTSEIFSAGGLNSEQSAPLELKPSATGFIPLGNGRIVANLTTNSLTLSYGDSNAFARFKLDSDKRILDLGFKAGDGVLRAEAGQTFTGQNKNPYQWVSITYERKDMALQYYAGKVNMKHGSYQVFNFDGSVNYRGSVEYHSLDWVKKFPDGELGIGIFANNRVGSGVGVNLSFVKRF